MSHAAIDVRLMELWSVDSVETAFPDTGFKKETWTYVCSCSPSLQTRENTFCSTRPRCKKCHIPISVTPVKSAASPRVPGRWGTRSCHHRGSFPFCMSSLYKNSRLTHCWKARQELGPWRVTVIEVAPNLLTFGDCLL